VPDLLEAAREVDSFCRRKGWRHCIIGGMALMRWGEQRMTKDVDLIPLAEMKEQPELVEQLRGLEGKWRAG
jgi:hypothetical protein